ncbi:hypothetical protein AVEN_134389-1 [Araneus ventricosus]|uniref:Uncharacterized protein n=1 Tax=Araneus ventricosus TaxID=182803 RepID=A0A4Y2KBQ0_ARAVE|nr:hypothetical protein AVEN_134389-1 [Araneus ventricosus]
MGRRSVCSFTVRVTLLTVVRCTCPMRPHMSKRPHVLRSIGYNDYEETSIFGFKFHLLEQVSVLNNPWQFLQQVWKKKETVDEKEENLILMEESKYEDFGSFQQEREAVEMDEEVYLESSMFDFSPNLFVLIDNVGGARMKRIIHTSAEFRKLTVVNMI